MTAIDEQYGILFKAVKEADEDFEWYPTTDRMIAAVARWIPTRTESIMDIGAGDGRVLLALAKKCETEPKLYAIEKSIVLIQAQPENVIPVGTDLFEQNLSFLPTDYIFCNPPYSQYALWASVVIETGYAQKAFLVLPQRWKDEESIAAALKKRGAKTRVIHSDDFFDGVRRARAVIDIVEVTYPLKNAHGWRSDDVEDPFDIWFDENISTFDEEAPNDYEAEQQRKEKELARLRNFNTITEMVEGYAEEYARMEANYRGIFAMDYALLKELGVNKNAVREGIKVKMAALKTKYWTLLFERLDAITDRLSTATKQKFLDKLTKRATLAFTESNAYAIVLWAIKNANKYFDEQVVKLFRDLSTYEGVLNYKSNLRTWKHEDWRYRAAEEHSKYALDYRIVVEKSRAMFGANGDTFASNYDYPGDLHKSCHDMISDVRAVLYNLGFQTQGVRSTDRKWRSGAWEDWHTPNSADVVFQTKAHKNGNLHFRLKQDAIKALNVEAGRLLGWLKTTDDVETELGYTAEEAKRFFASNSRITAGSVKLLNP